MAQLGLAINRQWTDAKTNEKKSEVTFVDVELWGKQAELAKQYLSKGKAIFVEGRLKFEQWDDMATGQKRTKLKVVAEKMQFLSPLPPKDSAAPQTAPVKSTPVATAAIQSGPQVEEDSPFG